MDIQISSTYRKNRRVVRAVSSRLKRFGSVIKNREKLSVAFVDDSAIEKLNLRFRKRRSPTNVLSFDIGQTDPEDGKLVRGEIIISVDTAAREAAAAGMPVRERLEALFVHGYAHLLGYDHTTGAAEAGRMRNKERMLIHKMNTCCKKSTGQA